MKQMQSRILENCSTFVQHNPATSLSITAALSQQDVVLDKIADFRTDKLMRPPLTPLLFIKSQIEIFISPVETINVLTVAQNVWSAKFCDFIMRVTRPAAELTPHRSPAIGALSIPSDKPWIQQGGNS